MSDTGSTPKSEVSRWFWADALVVVLVTGYLAMSRSFAYIGFSGLYVGEISLAVYLGFRARDLLGPLFQGWQGWWITEWTSWAFAIAAAYGVFEFARGLMLGHDAKTAMQCLVFNVYPVYFFVGVATAVRNPAMLARTLRVLAWAVGVYGLLYLVVLSRFNPGGEGESAIPYFGQPYGAAVAILGMLCFEPQLSRVVFPLLANFVVLMGMQVRAAWLGVAISLPFWGLLTGRLQRILVLGGAAAFLLGVALFFDLKMDSPSGRGGQVSVRDLVARGVAPLNPHLAAELSPHAKFYQGTMQWRTDWWSALWEQVHDTPGASLTGLGYGYPIWELHPTVELDEPVRTPHNVFMFALSYTGWIGVVLFYLFQLTLGRILWLAYVRTGQPFGICYWLMILAWSHFDNFFETPFGAIPFYLLTGMAAGGLFHGLAGEGAVSGDAASNEGDLSSQTGVEAATS